MLINFQGCFPADRLLWYNWGVMAEQRVYVGINAQLLSATRSYRSAGVSGYIRQLLLHLPEAAPDLALTAFVPGAAALEADGRLTLRRSLRWDTQRPLRRILWEQTVLPLLCQQARLDLLHATVNISPWLAPCPTVVTVHDLSFLHYPRAFPALQRLYLRTQARRSVVTARQVIAVSRATRQDLISRWGVPGQQISIVYNGVDSMFCPAAEPEIEAFRRCRQLPERFILHLGTLEPRKNLVRLVRAFKRLRQRAPVLQDVKLVLAGGRGWGYQKLFAEVIRLELDREVLFPGYVADEELPWWYRAAEVFAYPSLLEGFGLPVVEAMACGTPVVTSTTSALPEVAGDAALLVDPTSVEQLATALQRLLTEPELARELRERGLRQASRFSWQRAAQETVAVYRRALSLPDPAIRPESGQPAAVNAATPGGGVS